MRSYHISCTIILQSIDQIRAMYEDDWGTLMADCSTQIFLGSSNQEDLEYFSKALGSATQTVRNTSESKGGKGGGVNMSFNQDEFTLMKPEQLRVMPTSECIVIISGQDPFYDKKFRLEKHPNAHELNGNPFDHHLYFQLEDYVEPIKAKVETTPVVARQVETTHKLPDVPHVKEMAAKGMVPVGESPIRIPTPVGELLETVAEKRGQSDLADRINQGNIKTASLQPLYKPPIPKPALKKDATPDKVIDVVMYSDTGFPD